MRIIICVKTCYGGSGIEYNRNGVYRIFSEKCIKNEGQLMYAILIVILLLLVSIGKL